MVEMFFRAATFDAATTTFGWVWVFWVLLARRPETCTRITSRHDVSMPSYFMVPKFREGWAEDSV